MSTKLHDLAPRFRPFAIALLANFVEARIPVVIVCTLRTAEEQKQAIDSGHSWVRHSRHQDGMAIDVCPLETYNLHGANKLQWDASDSIWEKMGLIGESLGLRWGGRWQQKDMGHFELPEK